MYSCLFIFPFFIVCGFIFGWEVSAKYSGVLVVVLSLLYLSGQISRPKAPQSIDFTSPSGVAVPICKAKLREALSAISLFGSIFVAGKYLLPIFGKIGTVIFAIIFVVSCLQAFVAVVTPVEFADELRAEGVRKSSFFLPVVFIIFLVILGAFLTWTLISIFFLDQGP